MKNKFYTILGLFFLVFFFAPASVHAAGINTVGFESGDSLEADTTSGTFSVQTTTKRTGSYALQTNPTTTAIGYYDIRCYIATGAGSNCSEASIFPGFQFQYATLPASGDEDIADTIDTSNAKKMTVRINSDANLSVYNAAGTLLDTGATVLSASTWYLIEIKSTTGATSDYELKINGVSELSGTDSFGTGNNRGLRLGKIMNTGGNTVNYYYDDVIIDNAAYVGAGQVTVMYPNANGNYQTWSVGAGAGDHYTIVDEIPHDTDTTYLLSSGADEEAETEALIDSGTAGISGTVNMVRGFVVTKRAAGSNGSIKVRLRSGSTDSDSTGVATSSAYLMRGKAFATDPATSAAWLVAALDSVEMGAVENQTGTALSRMTLTAIMVHYAPAAAAAAAGANVDNFILIFGE